MRATIRPATDDDVPALQALDVAIWSPDVTPAPKPAADKPFATDGVLVAEVDGVVAGYVKLAPPTPLESNAHVLECRGLAVDPARQGAGLGRRLMEAAARDAAARGARKLTLRVLTPNTGARRLYESLGYEVEGVLRGEFLLGGRYVDDVLMALDLTCAP